MKRNSAAGQLGPKCKSSSKMGVVRIRLIRQYCHTRSLFCFCFSFLSYIRCVDIWFIIAFSNYGQL